ncbi:hypothetical protein GCM10025788_24010 [Serinicoccus chungangensis]
MHASLGDHHRAVGLTSKCGGTDKYANVMIVLAPVRDGTGPSRLLAMLDGRSKKVFGDWLAERDQAWRDGIEVVAMDGFAGLETATTEELPGAVSLMDPFHVVRLAGGAWNEGRRRVQQDLHGHRGRKGDPLYSAGRTLHAGAELLVDRQQQRLDKLFANEQHVQVEVTWGVYRRMITAYRNADRSAGRIEIRNLHHRKTSTPTAPGPTRPPPLHPHL